MKMKSSLSTSISCLIKCSGEQRRSFANGFSTSLFNTRHLRVFGCQWQGRQSSRTFSSYIEDAFEELGPPPSPSEGLATLIKLQTQKPELRMRNGPAKELKRSSSLGSRPRISSLFSDIVKPSKTSGPSLQDHKCVSGQSGDKKNRSKVDSCSIKAEVVTDGVENRATDSKVNASDKKNRSKVDSCSVKAEVVTDGVENRATDSKVNTSDKKNRSKVDSCSVKAEVVTDGVENCATDSKIVKIRIKDIAKGTTNHIIHSICKSIGVLEGLEKNENAVDVFFRVNNETDSQRILKRLNSTVIDESQWSAFELAKKNTPSPSSSSSPTKTIENDRYKSGLQISNALFDLKQQMAYKRLLCEDLELMHMSVMHLEGLPTIVDPSVV